MTNIIESTIANRDYVVVIDKSGSMTTRDCPGQKTRWEYCQESVQALTDKVCEYDPDGVDLYFFNTSFTCINNACGEKVREAFKRQSPMGSTSFFPVLNQIFNNHFAKNARPTTVLFITDGEANDPHETCKAIINATQRIEDDSELAISFIQVGKDLGARDFLKKLDDDLQGSMAKFDIVDTITMLDAENMGLDEILFNAITD